MKLREFFQTEEAFMLSNDGCSRATGYAETNKIVTLGDKTHVAWLDSIADGFRVRIRTLDRKTDEWSPTYTVGEAHDNHGGPALTVDSKGYLHIVYYPHHHPFRYRRSSRPNDASEWEDEIQFGQRCTYPTLVCGSDDTLYLTGREREDDQWGVYLYVKPPNEDWQKAANILRAEKSGYSHFQEALAWGADHRILHLSCRFYDGDWGHTVGYLRSPDGGKTWERSDGMKVSLPVTAKTVTVIDSVVPGVTANQRNKHTLRCGSIATDAAGSPYILYSSDVRSPSEALIVWLEPSGEWRRRSLRDTIPKEWSEWDVFMPGGITIQPDGRIFVVLTLMESNRWGHPSSEIIWFEASDISGTFTAQIVSEPDATVPHWLPSLERPTGHNSVNIPGLIYTAGTRAENNRQIVSNEVYWARLG